MKQVKQVWKKLNSGLFNGGRLVWLAAFLALFLLDAFPGFYFQAKIPHLLADAALWGIYFCALTALLFVVGKWARPVLTPAATELIMLGLLAYMVNDVILSTSSLGPSSDAYTYGATAAVVAVIWLFALGIGARKIFPMGTVLGALLMAGLIFLCAWPGPKTRKDFAAAQKEIPPSYKVEKITYGPKKAYDFGEESYSRYMSLPKRQDRLREMFFGYTPDHVPYEGDLYLPVGVKHAPLVVFVHGNHNMIEDNRGGYEYLGRYLAARGVAFQSVEQSHFNAYLGKGLSGENDARALSLLDHAVKVAEDPRLKERIDADRIYFGGHSRGGEAAAIAASFAKLPYNPDTGEATKTLNVAGVLAVAPTDSQYKPGDRPVALDVPYFLVTGAWDQDVASLEGMDQYMRARAWRGQLMVDYANHSQFNSNWGRLDREGLEALALDTGNVLRKEDQQRYLEVAAYAFVKDRAIFDDFKAYVPEAGVVLATEPESYVLADFEEDSDLTTASAEGASLDFTGASTYEEGAFVPSDRGGNNHVARLFGTLSLSAEKGAEGDFAMDVAAKRGRADVRVKLIDAAGEAVEFHPDKNNLHAALETGLLKWQYAAKSWEYKRSLETVRLSREAMAEANPAFSIRDLRRVEITAKSLTEIDNIRIETAD
ncbi:hypothetical protein [Aedoeadaptatus urinae]|uniref:hypothetical protein n=1 Tax=Aedoeadaptatus urinae TaxID=1871017 RepID=UPI00097D5559|nr:hypothetical protein [Peptoniphilus urinae]